MDASLFTQIGLGVLVLASFAVAYMASKTALVRHVVLVWFVLATSIVFLFMATKAMIRVFHERGVLITAGSDVAMPWFTPGVSFHRELELLVSTGISAFDVLTIGTQNRARALGIAKEVGTIEEGKRADLVVLRADPLDDIRNTRKIELIIANGKRYEPAQLLQ